ncbi:MAG: ATP-binding protein [Actinobacteria bacterium]|nr:ATP-binding protein [Actinomycetota bacterium]
MDNPFRPGNGIIPPYLAGREKETLWFENSLDSALSLPQNLVLSGIRGTGKTVLLRKFEEICTKKKWLFVRREFNSKLNQEGEFLNALLTDIITKTKGVSLAKRLKKPVIGFKKDNTDNTEEDIIYILTQKYKGPLGDKLEAILEDVYESIYKAGYNGLVLLYDEFHFIEDGKIGNNFPLSLLLESFSHVQQKGLRYYLVLSGLPPLFTNMVKSKTYAERMFSVKNIENLSIEASQKAIRLPLKKSKIIFLDELINTIVKETQGYPYFLQFYPYYLIQNIPKKKIGLIEFNEMYPLILKELDGSFFSGRFNRASDSEQKILLEMAKLVPEIRFSELREKTKIDKNYLNQIMISLIEKGLIFRIGRGKYSFTLPLFEKYLLRKG